MRALNRALVPPNHQGHPVKLLTDIYLYCNSLKHIKEFLLREEVSDKSVCMERKTDQETAALQLKGVSASWYKTGGEMTLKDVTMEVSPGQLCVIGGPVGSGKVIN